MNSLCVTCRVGECNAEATFTFVNNLNESEWVELSQFSMLNSDGERELRGYCPDHSLEAD